MVLSIFRKFWWKICMRKRSLECVCLIYMWPSILWRTYMSTPFIAFPMQLGKINVISICYNSVILCILWATLSCKHMWGSVHVMESILVCVTDTHFIYHPTWASCSEIHHYSDIFLTLQCCNLNHIVEDICDIIKV